MNEYIADCDICKERKVLCREVETKDDGEKEFKKNIGAKTAMRK